MSQNPEDRWLDEQLHAVPLPAGFAERLRAACGAEHSAAESPATWDDSRLDAELRGVPLPAGLEARVRAALREAAFDDRFQEVPLPIALGDRLKRIARDPVERLSRSGRRSGARHWPLRTVAAAAALIFLLWGGQLAGLVAIGETARLTAVPASQFAPLEVPLAITLVEPEFPEELVLAVDASAGPEVQIAGAELGDSPVELSEFISTPAPGAFTRVRDDLAAAGPLNADTLLLRWDGLSSPHNALDDLPELTAVPAIRPRGQQPPLVRGFDRTFLLSHGVNPLVFPALHEQLRVSRVNMATDTASYDYALGRLAAGVSPHPAFIRVEDFLAAVQSPRSPAAVGRVSLSAAAGASPFGQSLRGLAPQLLLVTAQAGPAPRRSRRPAHLVVAVDVSSSMQAGGRLEHIARALRELPSRLTQRDRLSLVLFNDEAVVALEQASLETISDWQEQVRELRPFGGTNLALGLQQAYGVAFRGEGWESLAEQPREDFRSHVVLVTDGNTGMSAETLGLFTALLREGAPLFGKVPLSILDAGGPSDDALAELASAGRGQLWRADSSGRMLDAFVSLLTAGSPAAADDVELAVAFRPEAVAAYRLLGHEANQAGGLLAGGLESRLRDREAASALYEVWLLPGTGEEIGQASVVWREPDSGRLRNGEKLSLGRSLFLPGFADAEPSLQLAAAAAATAEFLRESPFVPPGQRDLRYVRQVMREQFSSGLIDDPRVIELDGMIERVQQLRRGGR